MESLLQDAWMHIGVFPNQTSAEWRKKNGCKSIDCAYFCQFFEFSFKLLTVERRKDHADTTAVISWAEGLTATT